MSGLGSRLKEERKRLGLTQTVLGAVGGVKENTQANYEKGKRNPDSEYLAALSEVGVDILYVVTGQRTPRVEEGLSKPEMAVLDNYRALTKEDQGAVQRLTDALAQSAEDGVGESQSVASGNTFTQTIKGNVRKAVGQDLRTTAPKKR